MKRFFLAQAMMFGALTMGVCAAQTGGTQPVGQSTSAASPSANDQAPPAAQAVDNLPVSGVDQPNFETPFGMRSYLAPGLQVSEGIDSNVNETTGHSSTFGVTRVLGSLSMQKLWSRYSLGLDYVGGGAFYSNRGIGAKQVHQLSFEQRYLWKTGQFAVRDSFSYLPEGAFGYSSFGGQGALSNIGGVTGGLGGASLGFFGPGQFATLGQQENISNITIADVTQELSPRSSVTAAGSYGIVHFLNNTQGYINSNQGTAQFGYNYQLNRRDQVAVIYGYQNFHYPDAIGVDLTTHLWNLMYAHRITGRMDLTLGGGPQLTKIDSVLTGSTTRITGSGRASLRYRFRQASAGIYYDHYTTSGSGFYSGANTDLARFSVSRPVGRLWTIHGNVGYTRSSQLVPGASVVTSDSYHYWYVGGDVYRQLGRDLSLMFSYQFNRIGFSSCTIGPPCSQDADRHVALIGLNWTPRPMRLD